VIVPYSGESLVFEWNPSTEDLPSSRVKAQ